MRRHLWGRALSALLLLTVACGSKVAPPPQTTAEHAASPAPRTEVAQAPASKPLTDAVTAAAPEPHVEAPARIAQPAGAARQASRPDPSLQPAIADGPRRLAAQILDAERTIRDARAGERRLAVAGHTLQLAYRELSQRDRWQPIVYAELPKGLHGIVRLNLKAYAELDSLSGTKPPKTLPTWRIVRPAPRAELKRYYRKAQRIFGVPWQYLAAINLVETRMGRIRGTSTAGAQGPMQFIPPTWAIYGKGDINDPHDAIMAAARYLKARGAPGDMGRALYSYNNDVRYVRAVAAHAEVMRRDHRELRNYYHWQVYYRQPGGPVWLQVGYTGR